jgi:hypothetical protein
MAGDAETDEATKVLYILGTQRGGTNILGRVLGTIEGMVYGGELGNFRSMLRRDSKCECGQPYAECEVWSMVFARVPDPATMMRHQQKVMPRDRSWWHARRLLRSDSPLDPGSPQGGYAGKLANLYREFSKASGARVVIDASKHPGDAALLSRTPGISLFCIQIVRDPRGVAFSSSARRVEEREGRTKSERVHPLGTVHGSLAWLGRHLTSEAVRTKIGEDRALLVRYEDFMSDPAATLRSVSQLVGLPPQWPPFTADHTFHMPPVHTPLGRGRYAGDVTLAEDEEWKRHLRPFDRRIATMLTRPRFRRYGYSKRVRPSDAHPAPELTP